MVRTLLQDAGLPNTYWSFAVNHTTYVINWTPTHALKQPITPFKAYTRNKPSVVHLRIFGCKGYVHILQKDVRNWIRKCSNVLTWAIQNTKGPLYSFIDQVGALLNPRMSILMKANWWNLAMSGLRQKSARTKRSYLLKGRNRQSLTLTRLWTFKSSWMAIATTMMMVTTQTLCLRGMEQQGALVLQPNHHQLLKMLKIILADSQTSFVSHRPHPRIWRPRKPQNPQELTSESRIQCLQTHIFLQTLKMINFIVQQGSEGHLYLTTMKGTQGHRVGAKAPINQL